MTETAGRLVVGMGCRRGTPSVDLRAHLLAVLAEHGLSAESVAAFVSVEAKAAEPGLLALAAEWGVPLRTHPADVLRVLEVPSAGLSPDAATAVGTPSVAEAAVLAEGAELVVPKHVGPGSTVAIGRVTATDGDRPAPGARR